MLWEREVRWIWLEEIQARYRHQPAALLQAVGFNPNFWRGGWFWRVFPYPFPCQRQVQSSTKQSSNASLSARAADGFSGIIHGNRAFPRGTCSAFDDGSNADRMEFRISVLCCGAGKTCIAITDMHSKPADDFFSQYSFPEIGQAPWVRTTVRGGHRRCAVAD